MHPEKGVHLLIEAFKRVVETGQSVRLRIVGPACVELGGGGSSYVEHLKQLADGLPVQLVEPISDPQMLAIEYQNAHCFCYPSLAEHGEAFGLAPLEAMATGLPVVVSDLACFKDFVEYGVDGIVFDHRRASPAAALAEALDGVLRNPIFAAQLGQRAAEKAKGHAYDAVAGRYLALVESLAAQRAVPRHLPARSLLP